MRIQVFFFMLVLLFLTSYLVYGYLSRSINSKKIGENPNHTLGTIDSMHHTTKGRYLFYSFKAQNSTLNGVSSCGIMSYKYLEKPLPIKVLIKFHKKDPTKHELIFLENEELEKYEIPNSLLGGLGVRPY